MYNKSDQKVRNSKRRVTSTFNLIALPLAYAFILLSKVWYNFSFNTPKLILPTSYEQINNVTASANLTAIDMLKKGVVNSPRGSAAALSIGPLNMPMIFVFLVVSAAVLFAAIKLNMPTIALLSIYIANFSRLGVNSMRSLVEADAYGGRYMLPTNNINMFTNMVWLTMLISFSVAFQIFVAKRSQKQENSSIFHTIINMQKNNLANLLNTDSQKSKEKVN